MPLYHYCSNDTFLSILRNSEIWLSELTLSNDSMEGAWSQELLLKECQNLGMPEEKISRIRNGTNFYRGIFSTFGFCMSTHSDVLSQWRGYAANGGGVAIGFDHESLEKICHGTDPRLEIREISYCGYESTPHDQSTHDEIFEKFRTSINKKFEENIESTDIYEYIYDKYAFILKNPAFKEEGEFRILCSIDMLGSSYSRAENSMVYIINPALNFRARGDHIVPYLRLPIPDDKKGCIKEIILGPRNRTPEPVIRAALEKFGFQNVTIRRSAATYR